MTGVAGSDKAFLASKYHLFYIMCLDEVVVISVNLVDYLVDKKREYILDELVDSVDASKLKANSHLKLLWRCPKGHEYEATLYSRSSQGSGCPYCARQKAIIGETDIPAVRPDMLLLWDEERNGTASGLLPGAHKKVWWKCKKGHSWQQRIYVVAAGSGCPYCSGLIPIPGQTDLATTHPNLIQEWDYERNTITPQQISKGSVKKVFWKCKRGHSYKQYVYSRVAGSGCPYCAGKKVLAGYNDLTTTDPEICKEWSANNSLKPTEVNRGSHKKVNWICPLGHEYNSSIYSRVAGSGCPYCSGRKVLAGFNDLATTHPKVAAQWVQEMNGEITPQMVTKGTNQKFWFKCSEGHYWQAAVSSRTRPKCTDCPICAGNTKAAKRYRKLRRLDLIKQDKQRIM